MVDLAIGGKRESKHQRNSSPNIGAIQLSAFENRVGPLTMQRCGSHKTIWAPIEIQLVCEEHPARVHPVVEEDGSGRLGGYHNRYAHQVCGKGGPGHDMISGMALPRSGSITSRWFAPTRMSSPTRSYLHQAA